MLPSQSFRRWLKRRDFTSGHGQRRSSKCQRRCPKAIHSKNKWQAVSVGWIEIILAMEKWLICSSFSIHFPNYSLAVSGSWGTEEVGYNCRYLLQYIMYMRILWYNTCIYILHIYIYFIWSYLSSTQKHQHVSRSTRCYTKLVLEKRSVATSQFPVRKAYDYTSPKFNIDPENRPSQKETHLPTIIFWGLC